MTGAFDRWNLQTNIQLQGICSAEYIMLLILTQAADHQKPAAGSAGDNGRLKKVRIWELTNP